ncbi:hypothetical protein EFD55_07845 [Rhizobium pisi]|uniref:Uncharacterized protein n=1 Tax=Rhizobium pisi TaxID=574561 RepID=A0A3R9CMX1_9HYPH|nr:hypothetical protein EFD55_07845 [Rhizobium pisi]TCA50973.1 hypothetical protein E0J16_21365 [Rhizobium pisi]
MRSHSNPLPARGARGRALREAARNGEGAASPFAPRAGRRCRQADEGQVSTSSSAGDLAFHSSPLSAVETV